MARRRVAPYGSWRSPISAALIARGAVPLGQIEVEGGDVYWLEGRPLEGGRTALMVERADGSRAEVTPPDYSVRTRVNEYGGGAFLVHGSTVFFSNHADQRLYRLDPGRQPAPITPRPANPAGARYADGRATPNGRLILCVRELDGGSPESATEIVAIPSEGSAAPRTVVAGNNYYASPRIGPDGGHLAWLAWDHPAMPWDSTELWAADLATDGSVSNRQLVAGGTHESIFQPAWAPDGTLHFVSDRTGWWNLYRAIDGSVEPLAPMEAEFGVAQWAFGLCSYAFLRDGAIACSYIQGGISHLGTIRPGSGRVYPLELPYTQVQFLRSDGRVRLAFLAASPSEPTALVTLDLENMRTRVLRRSIDFDLDSRYISTPHIMEYPTEGGLTANAIFYPPANPRHVAPSGRLPPLLVRVHGGPTGMAFAALNEGTLPIQFWTSRGIGVVDVNYGGSTGYGRAYRERLRGRWGIVDVEDCVNATRYLVRQGEVDGDRLAIQGSSSGGYTALCALAFHDVFAVGASFYGIADLEGLVGKLPKLELHYDDWLIGPYPEARETYRRRSPIHFADRISAVILFQGLEDRVVPPSQAEEMARALRSGGVPFAYLAFEDESHGFRKAETVQRALEAQLYFFSRILGFPLRERVKPVRIENARG